MHSANRARKTVDLLRQETPDFIPPDGTYGIQISQIWTQSITRSGLSCSIVSTRQKSVAWMNGGCRWSTSGVALSRLSTWLLTTSVEDFERASIQKEDNSTTCELTILILSVSVSATFSVTFVWLLGYRLIFHSKSVPATTTMRHRSTRVFVLQGNAAAKSGYGGRCSSTLGRRYLLSDMPKKIIKIGQQLPKLQQMLKGHTFYVRQPCWSTS